MVERYRSNTARKPDPVKPKKRNTKNLPFQKGMAKPPGSGRKPGTPNKVPTLLRDALIKAAELEGSDRNGKGELIGFLRQASRTHKGQFLTLLGRVLPLQINANFNGEVSLVNKYKDVDFKNMSLEQKQAAMRDMLNMTRPVASNTKALPNPNSPNSNVVDGEFTEIPDKVSEKAS